ncbi:toxin-antitoxin system HicB family antitoxin [Castellaniella ginsengisoli]|uniref:Toxin-antitoxin system HicB family antitoxin n=1 Tax=Castellaniella ginsengisoli TaxID=546114 RepID=A0AB39FRJ6_9BURK
MLRVSPAIHEAATLAAAAHGKSLNQWVSKVLHDTLDTHAPDRRLMPQPEPVQHRIQRAVIQREARLGAHHGLGPVGH